MGRFAYIPYDPIREEEREDDRLERKAMRKEQIDWAGEDERFGLKDPNDPAYASLEAFAAELRDSGETKFDHNDVQCLNFRLQIPAPVIRANLMAWGFQAKHRELTRHFRGARSNPNNRWSATA